MSASLRNRLLVFTVTTIAVLIVIAILWSYLIAAPYNRALVATTDFLSSAEIRLGEDFEQADQQRLGLKEENIYFSELQEGELVLHGWLEGPSLHYGMLLLISLIAATPGLTWRRRITYIPLAIIILFILHIITILIFATISLSGTDPSRSPFVTLFIILGTALFPALVWGAMSLRYWFSGPQSAGKTMQ
ncbi:MAG: hypothetical protein SVM79_08390 [Chloroflexota bacterium]|nr:hypothetical protein [Chloroflexota bacterium]